MRPSFAWALFIALPTLACGGESTTDKAGGGSAGTGAVAGSGGTAGSGGVGGLNTGGAAAIGGSGGSAGNECPPDVVATTSLGGPKLGFDSVPSTPGMAVLVEVTQDSLDVSIGPDAPLSKFYWVGPDLTTRFTKGESVSVGAESGWQFVAGAAYTAAAYRQFGFVADAIPAIPYYGPNLSYSTQCTFMEASGGCGAPPGTVKVLAIEATTGAGAVVIPHGATGSLVGWEITNVNNVQYPGYGSDTCVVEAGYSGFITALGPALDKGGG